MAKEILIDHAVVEALLELGENTGEALLEDLTRIYLETAPQTLSHLRNHLTAQDHDAAVKAAHSLKSSSSALGLLRISHLAGALEAAARGVDLAAATALLAQLEQAWEPSNQALCAYSPGVV